MSDFHLVKITPFLDSIWRQSILKTKSVFFLPESVRANCCPAQLDALGHILKNNSQVYVVLSSFCDSVGSERYNIGLSQRRAESVRRYLQKKFAIKSNRVLLYWYGYANPVATNATAEGRQLNRRVTIVLRGQP